jgi:transposase
LTKARSSGPDAAGRGCAPSASPGQGLQLPPRPQDAPPARHRRRHPTRKDQRRNPHFDRAAYRTRERVERLINRLKQFRRVATRYEKRGHHYLAFVTLAAIILWLPV